MTTDPGTSSTAVAALVEPTTRFAAVAAEWLAHAEPQLRGAAKTYKLYVKTHFGPFFGTIGEFNDEACSRYVSHRLRSVQRATLQKELSALRWFAEWCADSRILTRAPRVPKPRRGAVGTRYFENRPSTPVDFTRAEVEAVIAALPEYSESKRVRPFPIRARFVVALETGLRPSTLDRIEAPLDYSKGASTLRLRGETDKNLYGRELPLNAAARAALDAVCPEEGLIFGRHDYRDALERAATATLSEDRAKHFTSYVLRHTRLTEFAETGNLVGAAYLAGHRQVTTINRYARPNRRAAEQVLSAVDAGRNPSAGLVVQPHSSGTLDAGVGNSLNSLRIQRQCEGEDLNLHGSNPASTSS
jgi:integrase